MKMAGPIQLDETNKLFPFRVLFDDVKNPLLDNHWHKEVEIIYLLKGSLQIYINGIGYSLDEGDIVYIVSGDVHGAARTLDSIRIVIQFDLGLIEDKFIPEDFMKNIRHNLDGIERVSTLWPEGIKRDMKNIIFQLRESYSQLEQGFEASKLVIKALLHQMIYLSITRIPKSDEHAKSSAIMKNKEILSDLTKVISYINENLSENITLKEAAKVLNFSPNYFLRFWKKHMGITFHTYLNQYRLNIAATMLMDKDLRIGDIASRVGINNVKTFNRLFKDATGISPNQYKKRYLDYLFTSKE